MLVPERLERLGNMLPLAAAGRSLECCLGMSCAQANAHQGPLLALECNGTVLGYTDIELFGNVLTLWSVQAGTGLGPLLVLERLERLGMVRLTRKASLLAAAASLPRAMADIAEGRIAPGYVASVTADAVFVRFLNGFTGRAGAPAAVVAAALEEGARAQSAPVLSACGHAACGSGPCLRLRLMQGGSASALSLHALRAARPRVLGFTSIQRRRRG